MPVLNSACLYLSDRSGEFHIFFLTTHLTRPGFGPILLMKTVFIIIKRGSMPRYGRWHHRLSGQGTRWTAPRQTILDLLSQTDKHMSAKDVYAALHKTYPALGLTTVYRTLDLLVRMGLLNKLSFGTGESRYEFRSGKDESHHHHLICIQCGTIIDYTDFVDEELELVKKTEASLAKKHDFKIMDHNIEFYGLCPDCKDHI